MTPVKPRIDHVVAVARDIRTGLRRMHYDRNLAGQCGLASMMIAVAIGDPTLLRTGFYMKRERLYGRFGRVPHRHAWCQIGPTLVDVTATQFGRHRAVHVVTAIDDDRYIETCDSSDAIDDIMDNWRGRDLSAYVILADRLRGALR